jgi:outer membrane protein assembly factor BamB
VGRTGSQTYETQLSPATVSGGHFGRVFTATVDGTIQAQPLYAPGVMIQGAAHNVVFVATENDSVYALDADTGSQYWTVSLGMAAPFVGSPWTCKDLIPESGISATPVLDATAGILYVLAETLEGGVYHHKLHALDWATGSESKTAVEIAPPQPEWTAPPANHFSRAGLLLDRGTVFAAFSSHCDQPAPWYGWVVAYDASSLALQGSFETGKYGGIWQSGQGLSTDGNGGVFFVAGVGSAAGTTGCNATNLCQTVGRLTLGSSGLTLASFYQPASGSPAMNGGDLDLTTAFVLTGTGLGFATGKDGTLHGLDPATMTSLQDVQVPASINGSGTGGHIHGGPVYWNGAKGPLLYAWPEANPLAVYTVTASGLTTTPIATNGSRLPSHPGPILTVSSNGTMPGTGVLWAAMITNDSADAWHSIVPGTLYAFDAENPSDTSTTAELWNSDANPADALGLFAKFCPPTVANGKVYVGTAIGTDNSSTTAELRAYGLTP